MFLRSLAKAERYNGEGKALCIACNHIHKSMITTSTFVRHLHCHRRRLQRVDECFFFILKHEMWCHLLFQKTKLNSMYFNFVNWLYWFSYYYLNNTTQLQFDWYYLECAVKKNLNLWSNLFLQMNSSYTVNILCLSHQPECDVSGDLMRLIPAWATIS